MTDTMYSSGEYLANVPHWHERDAPKKAAWIAAALDRAGVAPRRIVDIGCGVGGILAELAKRYPEAELEGCDISPQAYEVASKRQTDKLRFRHADYLAEPGARADVVMAIDVFEHVDDYMGFIRKMQPLGEFKVFHIPMDLSVQTALRGGGLMNRRNVLGHLHYFNKDTALATLRDCGLEIVTWNYTYGAEEQPGRKLATRLLGLGRRALALASKDLAMRTFGGGGLMVVAR